ncbi:hypothetical protein [Vagococcus elongatus]
MLAEMNIPLRAIMDRVGMMTKKTQQIYTHVTKKMKVDIINKLNQLPSLI